MPFTTQELSDAGLASLDYHLRNNPIDQIATERPLAKWLVSKQKEFPGGKQFVQETLRKSYGSNFQWYYGAQQVTYNSRQTLNQANFAWSSVHDGYFIDEDRLFQNGIVLDDNGRGGRSTDNERIQLANLFEEQNEVLRLGYEEQLDIHMHENGAQSTEAVAGVDHLVSTDPTVGTVGGIDAAANTWWRNHAVPALTSANILASMDTAWRAAVRNGGFPDFILAGSTFVDTYTVAVRAAAQHQADIAGIRVADMGIGMQTSGTDTGLKYKGLPIVWDPVAEDLDTLLAPPTPFVKRCYFLNSRHMKLRPATGHNMNKRRPPREHDRYVHYFAITTKLAFTTNRRSAAAVLSVA